MTTVRNDVRMRAHHIIRDAWIERKTRNSGYSVRAFARDLGVSQTLLSLVLSGKRPVTLELAARIAAVLKFSPEKSEIFLRTTAQDHPKQLISYRKLSTLMGGSIDLEIPEIRNLDIERYKLLSHWYQLAILDYLTLLDADRSASKIAQAFGVTEIEVRDTLDRLEILGLAKQDLKQGWIKAEKHVRFPTKKTNTALREFHKQMIQKAQETLSDTSQAAFEKRSVTGMTFGIDSSRISEATQLIQEFQEKLAALLCGGKPDDVYQLNVQLFPLTKRRIRK